MDETTTPPGAPAAAEDGDLEQQVAQWRGWVARRPEINAPDLDELEDHLRNQIDDLHSAGLSNDEAFLIAVRRLGNMDEVSREYAREHSDRLWKQLSLTPDEAPPGRGFSKDALVAIGFAVLAGLAVKLPGWLGVDPDSETFYLHNVGFLVLPILAAFFVWRRRPSAVVIGGLVAAFAVAAVFANVYPWRSQSSTEYLSAMHMPALLWLLVGIAYVGGRWREHSSRMDHIRFTGEWVIYFALIALGGGALVGLTFASFEAIGIDPSHVISNWVMPCGAAGAVVIAGYLVESKQNVIENMAPVLTKVFTPLASLMMIALAIAMAVSGTTGERANREVLIIADVVLILVVGLLLYAWSARESTARPGLFDTLQLVLVLAALVVDLQGLFAMVSRISEFGASPNKVAALGLNLILLVNLIWTAWLLFTFLRRRRPFDTLVRWQTRFVPIYAAWAAIVVIVFPLVFNFG